MKNPFVNPVADSLDIANSFSQNDGAYFATDQVRARDADGLKLYDDGGNGIFVKDAGNVGIGTATPDSILSICSANQNAVVNIYGVATAADYGVIQVSSVGGLTNPQNRFLVLQPNAGNVGIGTVNPNAKLDIAGTLGQSYGNDTQTMLLHTKDWISDTVISGCLPATSTTLISDISAGVAYSQGRRIVKVATSKTYTASKDTYVDLKGDGTYVFTEVLNAAAAPAIAANSIRLAKVVTDATAITSVADLRQLHKIFVNSSGRVGIGTTTPAEKLEVNGHMRINGSIYSYAAIPLIQALVNTVDGPRIIMDVSGGAGRLYTTRNSGALQALTFGIDSVERMRVDISANVGIGTTSPSSLLDLQKAGTVKANLDLLELTNSGNAVDMDGTQTSILFNQWYYDATTPAVADAGRITVGAETDWTSVAATQDAYMFSKLL
uniref:Putative structural protein n=1 Tax=viral metagenome TaxID=1070528 RepID=A0A6M3IE19_9ZZZZ